MRRSAIRQLLNSQAPTATLWVRFAVGFVFAVSGIVKFLYDNQGQGRFLKLGFSAPEATAYFVGAVELVAGGLLMLGLLTRLAAISVAIDMLVALWVSKLPLLLGAGPEPVAAAPKVGLWAFAYAARLDLTMLSLALFLAAVGGGAASLDIQLLKRWTAGSPRRSPAEASADAA